jgi:hypothetical protein
MTNDKDPVVLELAPLPREQIGPFLILGLDKDAGKDEIEANWARRVIWARKSQVRIPLEDINWAREAVNDPERRPRCDAGSLNADTVDGTVRRLCARYAAGDEETPGPAWKPLDSEKDLRDYVPAVEVPDPEEVRAAIAVPDVPHDIPAAGRLLEQFRAAPLDPWAPDLLA